MDLVTLQKLLDPAGWALLTSLPAYDEATAHTLGPALREAGYDADVVAAALTQSRLRAKARTKLGDFADGMLFTADGVEQATRLDVAARHAARFRDAGFTHVTDLGCGIGADAMAFSALGLAVHAVDADPVTAAIAQVNLRHFPTATARLAAAEDVELGDPATTGVWFDPARRIPGVRTASGRAHRTFSLDQLSPSWEFVQATAASHPATGAKLSPSFPHRAVPAGAEAQWVSWEGDVVECALWWGPLVRTPGRTALLLSPSTAHTVTEHDAPDLPAPFSGTPEPGMFLYDPNKAVLRAGLLGAITAVSGGAETAAGEGYVLADQGVTTPLARCYQVTDVLPWQTKPLKQWLRQRGVGRLTIKKKDPSINPQELRGKLGLDGKGAELTVVITKVGATRRVLVVELLPAAVSTGS